MKNVKIVKRFLLIFCLILSFSFNFNLMHVFATEPSLNPPSNNAAEQPVPNTPTQNQPAATNPSTYKKPTVIKNNHPQQNNVSNFNNSNQNSQQNLNETQNNSIPEQTQQNTEKNEEIKKDKKEISKSTGKFSAVYPEKFKWIESGYDEDTENNEDAENTEDKDSKPKDLPEAKDEEIVLPEVIRASETKNESSVSLLAGIIAWSCILAGIGIILFVLFMNKNGGEFPVDSEKSKKKRKSSIPRKYYKGNF